MIQVHTTLPSTGISTLELVFFEVFNPPLCGNPSLPLFLNSIQCRFDFRLKARRVIILQHSGVWTDVFVDCRGVPLSGSSSIYSRKF